VVGFVMTILSFFVKARLRLVFGLAAIISFALIVGLSATVVRASIMAALLLVAQTFGRTYDVLRSLFVAGLVMIVINPDLLLFDIGFQLSFMATLGLIAALPWLDGGEQPELLLNVRGYVVATIATQIAVLPLLIYQIGQVSVVSVPVNVLVLPAVPFAMLGSFLAAVVNIVWPTGGLLLGYGSQLLLEYIMWVASWFAGLQFAAVELPAISAWWILGMYAVIGYLYWWLVWRVPSTADPLADWEIMDEAELKSKTDSDREPVSKPVDELPKMFR
jgi:competence protein ComEC